MFNGNDFRGTLFCGGMRFLIVHISDTKVPILATFCCLKINHTTARSYLGWVRFLLYVIAWYWTHLSCLAVVLFFSMDIHIIIFYNISAGIHFKVDMHCMLKAEHNGFWQGILIIKILILWQHKLNMNAMDKKTVKLHLKRQPILIHLMHQVHPKIDNTPNNSV